MASESLFVYTKARLFRIAGYGVTAAIVLSLFSTLRNPGLLLLALLYCGAAPFLIGWAKRRGGGWNIGYQSVENVTTLAMVGLAGLPPLATLLVISAVLTGNVAQGGLRFLTSCLPMMAIGWGVGGWVFVVIGGGQAANGSDLLSLWLSSNVVVDGLSACSLLVFVTCISSLGYRQTMRMYTTREDLRCKTDQLRRLNERISRYLPPQVTHRLFSLAEPLLPLKRKWITVCFIDIAHFTRMTAELAPEETALVLNDFLKAMTLLAAGVGGMVDKFIGDAVMIIFGDPSSEGRKSEAERALELVLGLSGCLSELSRFWQDQGIDRHLSVRVGVASGFCTVGDFGNAERLDYTVIGPAVNLASRLQSLAGVSCALFDRASYSLLQRRELFGEVGTLEVRGLASHIEAYRLNLEPREGSGLSPVVDLEVGSDKVRASLH